MAERKQQLRLFVTAVEIAEQIIDLHPRTLKRAFKRGEIRGHFHLGKWRFETESVLDWIKRKKVSPEPVAPIAKRTRPRGRPRMQAERK